MGVLDYFRTLCKTVYFNIRVFGITKAFKFNVIIGPRIILGELHKGCIVLANPHFGCLRIGVGEGSFHKGKQAIGYVSFGEGAQLKCNGKAFMAQGIVLKLSNSAHVELGDRFSANYSCIISIEGKLVCNNNTRLGWEVTVIDSDGHVVKNLAHENIVNNCRPVQLGEDVWLGAKSTIMKGVSLANNTIVPYGSIITKSNDRENCIFGGSPNRILKENVYRDYESEKNL